MSAAGGGLTELDVFLHLQQESSGQLACIPRVLWQSRLLIGLYSGGQLLSHSMRHIQL